MKISCVSLIARQACFPSQFLLNIILEVLANAIRQEKEITGIWIGKGKIQLFLFSDEMITNVKNPKEIPRTNKWLEQGCKIQG